MAAAPATGSIAPPNVLNAAVSRARRRPYVIGSYPVDVER